MVKETLKRIFDFLENQENKIHKDRDNFIWKLKFNESLTKDDLVVNGDLDLTDSTLKSLPDNLEVKGDMQTRFSKIEELPKGLKVGGTLWLLRCEDLTSLPKGLRVGLHLDIWNSPLKKYTDDEIREMIKPGFINGKIFR